MTLRRPGERGWRARKVGLWAWFFPPAVGLPAEVRELLGVLYPTLELDRIRFHVGLPHLVRALGVEAITLPAQWTRRGVRIYVRPRAWAPRSIGGLGTIAHEAFHALQIQESGWGFGPFRPFLWLYFAHGAANGFRYRGHPMEGEAYRLAGRGSSALERLLRAIARRDRDEPADLRAALPEIAPLAQATAGLALWDSLVGSTPWVGRWVARGGRSAQLRSRAAVPLIALWSAPWIAATAFCWTAFAVIEGIGLALGGIPRLVGQGGKASRGRARAVSSDPPQY